MSATELGPPRDVTEVGPEAASRAYLTSVRIVETCVRYAERSRYHGIMLDDLCKVSGASERRVRLAFSECCDMSPTTYLRAMALHAVRRSLLHGEPARDAVSRAASDFGFWHLSRFAGRYRTQFGESPSETVARRSRPR